VVIGQTIGAVIVETFEVQSSASQDLLDLGIGDEAGIGFERQLGGFGGGQVGSGAGHDPFDAAADREVVDEQSFEVRVA
jgi:hypothetical protein